MKTLQITGEYLTGEPRLEEVEETKSLPYVAPPQEQVPAELVARHWSTLRVEQELERDRASITMDMIDLLSAYCVAVELTQKALSHPDGCGPISCWCGLNNAKAAIGVVHQKLDAIEAKRRGGA